MLHVIWNAEESKQRGREGINSYSHYLYKILDYLGYSYTSWDHASWIRCRPTGTAIVIGGTDHENWSNICHDFVQSGNSLLVIGDSYGLQDIFGIRMTGRIHEGWIEWGDAPLAEELKSSFHFFGARSFECMDATVQQYGTLISRNGGTSTSPALIIRELGKGMAALLNFDLMKTFCLIQQGLPVIVDGPAAPDGSGAIDEGILKTDDGSVLDWVRDREAVEQIPFYLHPILDEIRCMLNRLLVLLEHHAGCRLVQKWYWPNGLNGIGHISHDTDGNNTAHAETMLHWLKRANVRSTWCIIMPGYEQAINDRIVNEGHEVALHYNALEEEIEESRWSEEHFLIQLKMLQEQFPDYNIITNKNHYLRWEGDVQFYKWCERAGIKVEQSKGGTKQGNKGFLAGTSHPYVPISNAYDNNRCFDIISLPTLAWDPPFETRCNEREAYALMERSRDVYGVAHFLFHPTTMAVMPEGVAGELLVKLVEYGRKLGMEWWTSEQIWLWFQSRTQSQVRIVKETKEIMTLTISTESTVNGFTVLISVVDGEELTVKQSNSCVVHSVTRVSRFGCDYVEIILDAQSGSSDITFVMTKG